MHHCGISTPSCKDHKNSGHQEPFFAYVHDIYNRHIFMADIRHHGVGYPYHGGECDHLDPFIDNTDVHHKIQVSAYNELRVADLL